MWLSLAQTPALSLCRSQAHSGLQHSGVPEADHYLSNTNATLTWGLASSLHSQALGQTFGWLSQEDREQGWGSSVQNPTSPIPRQMH